MVNINECLDIRSVVRSMAEYVMLNSAVTDSTSLFYGRAGMSICLFQAARFLGDEFIEDYAFDLLMQSLLNEKKDIRFGTGLSGIGFVLKYTIDQKFVDADFGEIFHKQHEMIVNEFLSCNFNSKNLTEIMSLWQIMLYFRNIRDSRVFLKAKELNGVCVSRFLKIWGNIRESSSVMDKEQILNNWRIYLKVLSAVGDISNYEHIREYVHLVKKGFLKGDARSICYISSIIQKTSEKKLRNDVDSLVRGEQVLVYSTTDCLNAKCLYQDPYFTQSIIKKRICEAFLSKKVQEIEESLNSQVGLYSISSVFSFGVSGIMLGLMGIDNKSPKEITEILSLL